MLLPNKDFKEQMTEARRIQILRGAAQVFGEKGFHKATTREIAKAAGVSEGTIYNYFENKRELLLTMLDLIGYQTLKAVAEANAQADPKTFLNAVLKDRHQLLRERGQFMAPIIAEIFTDAELREAVYQQVARPVIAHLENYFQAKIDEGVFRPLNPLIVARALVGTMLINTAFMLTELDPRYETITSEAMIEEIVSLFVEGLLIDKGE